MDQIRKYFKAYSFILLWLIGGAIHNYVGGFFVLITFLLMLKKEMYVQVLISFWILLIFSDSQIPLLGFAHFIKPIVVTLVGVFSIFLMAKKHIKNTFFHPFVVFFIYVIISSMFHAYVFLSLQKGLSYLFIYFIPPALFLIISQQNKTDEFLKSIVFFGNLILISCLVLGLFFPSIGAQFDGRLNGVFRNPNGIGLFIILYGLLAYVIYHTIPFSKRKRQLTILLIVLVLILSGSRSALGALIIFSVGASLSKRSTWIFAVFTVLFFFIYQPLYDLAIITVYKFGYSELFRLETLDMASGRIYVWEAAWREIKENLFFFGGGFTYSEYRSWLAKYYIEIPDLIQHQGNVHQSFLSLWMNTGIIGLVLFAFGWLRNILVALKKSPFTLPIVAALIFSASYESWLIASLNPFTIQLIFIFTIILFYKKEENDALEKEIIKDTENMLKLKQLKNYKKW